MTRRHEPRSIASAGARRGRRTLIAPDASPEEAAAIVAALERFIADTAPPPPPATPPGPGRWLRAALREGIGRGERRRGAWGDPHP